MLKKSAICYTIAAMLALVPTGCNSKDDTQSIVTSSSVMITGFSLSSDDKVMYDLDKVFFSIDLYKGTIFNADSLPYGTKIDRLVPKISSPENLAVCELTFSRAEKSDTTVNYLTNSTDSIDFSRGPVTLRVVSPNGTVDRRYTISVNVHKVKSDSLVWSRTERRSLPSLFQVPNDQCTAATLDAIYCLTMYQGRYSMAKAEHPAADWGATEITLPFEPQLSSLRATDDALYMLSDAGALWTSIDGLTWTDCGITLDYIYGGYTSTLFGSVEKADGWYIVTYPAVSEKPAPGGFPVKGTSLPIVYRPTLSEGPQLTMLGGLKADGTACSSSWGFDGNEWADITVKKLPEGIVSPAVVPYFTYKNDTGYWEGTSYATLVAIGGADAQGVPQRSVYTSLDFGMTWNVADSLMFLPDYIPAMTDVQGFVYKTEMNLSRCAQWQSMPDRKVPSWLVPEFTAVSRVTSPVTEWECPYIYLFGGRGDHGQLYNTVWRGVINRYTFKPLY